jgi:phosphatidylethanolamine/phosphatidyl-N-methylethanolamine N-methyltransferase
VAHSSPLPTDQVATIYQRLAPVYDLIYGATLEPGRRQAMTRLAPAVGERILEIGVGTGLSAVSYPRRCRVFAIDTSQAMLEQARLRFARRRVEHVTLCLMDATHLGFPDETFDAVYAPYVINVVPDPIAVAREMLRVCRPYGRLVLLNHFRDTRGSWLRDLLGRAASRAGVNWGMDLQEFLRDAGLVARSVERVNLSGVSSVVMCHKPSMTAVPQTRRM